MQNFWSNYTRAWDDLQSKNPKIFRNPNFSSRLTRRLNGNLENVLAIHNPSHFVTKRSASTQAVLPKVFTRLEWNEEKFNYTKVQPEEILFKYGENEHFIMINASPIVDYHGLIVPYCQRRIAQALMNQKGKPTVSQVLDAVADAWKTMENHVKLMYNSLGAWSSVNHHHWHIVSTNSLPIPSLGIETAKRDFAKNVDDVDIHFVSGWPIQGWTFSSQDCHKVMVMLAQVCPVFVEVNTPHTIVLCKSDCYTAYFFPRAPQQLQVQQDGMGYPFSVAVAETSGIALLPTVALYESLTLSDYASTLDQVNLFSNPPSDWTGPTGSKLHSLFDSIFS